MAPSLTCVGQTTKDSVSKKPEHARPPSVIFGASRAGLLCYLQKSGFTRKTELRYWPDLLNTVLPQAEKTAGKPLIGINELNMLMKCLRIGHLTACSRAVNASEITLCEDAVSSNNEALKTKNRRPCRRYEEIIQFFAYQNADLYYYVVVLDIHRFKHSPLSPDRATYPQICSNQHRSSLGLVDPDLLMEERPYLWSDPEALSSNRLFRIEYKVQSRVTGIDLPKTRSGTLVRNHSFQVFVKNPDGKDTDLLEKEISRIEGNKNAEPEKTTRVLRDWEAILSGKEVLQTESQPQIASPKSVGTKPNRFQILVRTPMGNTILICTHATDRAIDLKNNIANQIGYPAGEQNLVTGGRSLQDHRSLKEYNIKSGSTIILNMRL